MRFGLITTFKKNILDQTGKNELIKTYYLSITNLSQQ